MDFRPDLIPTIRKLEIHAKRNVLSQTLAGNWMSKIKGRGIEFSGYRQYTSGDDANLIDWKASVRSRKLLVKEFTEERNLNIFLLVDVSDSMLFGTTDKIKAEYVAELISSMSFAALTSGESVSLSLFSSEIKSFVDIKQGLAQHATLMKVLSDTRHYGGKKNFIRATTQLMGMMRVPGLIVVISDFIGLDSLWEKQLKIMAARYDLLCICVRDPRDRRLPDKGEYVLQDPSTNEKIVIDAADYAKPYREYVENEEKHLEHLLHVTNADFLLLETSEDYTHKLMNFFMIHNLRTAG